MKKIIPPLLCVLLIQHYTANAQSLAINTTGTAAHASAMLDVTSINKGLLIPRLTTAQRTAIASPGKGLLVYDTTLKYFYFHDGLVWQQIIADSNNLWRKNGTGIYNANTGKVGIGIATAQSLLHVKGGAVLFDSSLGSTPVSGAGTRMMWIPAKGAFRAGVINNTQWDDVNIGNSSTAFGEGTTANGNYSTAMGLNTVASGDFSTAMGSVSTASGNYSFAIGDGSIASGESSIAMGRDAIANSNWCFAVGYGTVASGGYSTAMGDITTASGNVCTAMGLATTATGAFSTSMGYVTLASGESSTSMGSVTVASGSNSTAMGNETKSKSFSGFVAGVFNDSTNAASALTINPLNRIFQIGNGTANNARSNAITVLQNGNVGIGELSPAVPLNFTATLGNKIALWGTGANHFGMGIQPSLLQIYTDISNSDIAFGHGNSAAFTERMRIEGTGNVGIGTPLPTAKLSVNGTANNTTGVWAIFSDERIKTISGDFTDGLNVIKQIQPVNFVYNDKAPFRSNDAQIGIVAQDLEKIAPYMVSQQPYQEFNDLREVNSQAYTFLLINAVKEQQLQIESQQKENREQKERIDKLEKLVNELAGKIK